MSRLTQAQLKAWREQQLAVQKGRCALCKETISTGEEVADHDHKTGELRGVLHRGCNAMLGHIENNRPRHKLTSLVRLARFLSNVAKYIAHDYTGQPLYPTHRTPDEKREARNAKARKARAKAKEKT